MTNQTTPAEAPADRTAPPDTLRLEALISDLAERYVSTYRHGDPASRVHQMRTLATVAAHWLDLPVSDVEDILEGGPRRPTIENVPAMVTELMWHAGKAEPAELPAPTHIRIPLDIDLLARWVTDDDEDDGLLLVALTEWIDGLPDGHLNALGDATRAEPAHRADQLRAALTEIARADR